MKKRKIKLDSIQIKSFSTELGKQDANTVIGGHQEENSDLYCTYGICFNKSDLGYCETDLFCIDI